MFSGLREHYETLNSSFERLLLYLIHLLLSAFLVWHFSHLYFPTFRNACMPLDSSRSIFARVFSYFFRFFQSPQKRVLDKPFESSLKSQTNVSSSFIGSKTDTNPVAVNFSTGKQETVIKTTNTIPPQSLAQSISTSAPSTMSAVGRALQVKTERQPAFVLTLIPYFI